MTDHDRIDLSALDPENDPDRVERIVSGVLDGLGPALVPNSPPMHSAVGRTLAGGFGRVAVAAAVAAAIATVYLSPDPPAGAARAVERSGPDASTTAWTQWLDTGQPPRAEGLLLLLGESQP